MTRWTEDGLGQAWRALALQEGHEEWRFVHLATIGEVAVEAGCQFPASREAIIVSFPGSGKVNPDRLPQGQGFDVTRIVDQETFTEREAVALVRRMEGSRDIFTVMVIDVLRTIEAATQSGNPYVMDAFLERVREWQAFMAQTHRPLSTDAQVGLMGELWMLRLLMNSSLGAHALNCWQGPFRAAQDFHVGDGAIEVKSTVKSGAFQARINSIEQLDSDRSPLFLCALRFEEDVDGQSLVGLVEQLRERFGKAGVRQKFEALLMVMGYQDDHAQLYGRTLTVKETRALRAEGDMQRLTRAAIPAAVRSASYVLDLDSVGVPTTGLPDLLNTLGLD